jgi:hypothetical protein
LIHTHIVSAIVSATRFIAMEAWMAQIDPAVVPIDA